MLHASSSMKISLTEMCWNSTWPTRLGVHGSPLEDGALPDSDQEAAGADLERLLRHARFPTAPNPLRVRQLRSLLLSLVKILLGLGETTSRPLHKLDARIQTNSPLEEHWRLTVLPGGRLATSSTLSRLNSGPGLRWRLRDPSPSPERWTTARLAKQGRGLVWVWVLGAPAHPSTVLLRRFAR